MGRGVLLSSVKEGQRGTEDSSKGCAYLLGGQDQLSRHTDDTTGPEGAGNGDAVRVSVHFYCAH